MFVLATEPIVVASSSYSAKVVLLRRNHISRRLTAGHYSFAGTTVLARLVSEVSILTLGYCGYTLTASGRALLTSELEEVFRNAPPAPGVMAAAQIRDAYNQATGKSPSSSSSKPNRRMPTADDSCAICYECMEDANGSSLTWCETCGNALHKECFQQCRGFHRLPLIGSANSLLIRRGEEERR